MHWGEEGDVLCLLPVLLWTTYVTLGKTYNLTGIQFPHLYNVRICVNELYHHQHSGQERKMKISLRLPPSKLASSVYLDAPCVKEPVTFYNTSV